MFIIKHHRGRRGRRQNKDKMNTETAIMQYNDPAYSELVNHITNLWTEAKADAITAVNAHLLEANWKTGQCIVEFEQKGQALPLQDS